MDWMLIVVMALGVALGLWLGWMKWREPALVYAEIDDAVDEALGLALLPDIRVPYSVAVRLKQEANTKGMIVQAHVREILLASGKTPNAQDQPLAEGKSAAAKC